MAVLTTIKIRRSILITIFMGREFPPLSEAAGQGLQGYLPVASGQSNFTIVSVERKNSTTSTDGWSSFLGNSRDVVPIPSAIRNRFVYAYLYLASNDETLITYAKITMGFYLQGTLKGILPVYYHINWSVASRGPVIVDTLHPNSQLSIATPFVAGLNVPYNQRSITLTIASPFNLINYPTLKDPPHTNNLIEPNSLYLNPFLFSIEADELRIDYDLIDNAFGARFYMACISSN